VKLNVFGHLKKHVIFFDIDVVGGLRIKEISDETISFVKPQV
jgi:hypothetical protein